eukprot:3132516-Rhodomonas_salina.1
MEPEVKEELLSFLERELPGEPPRLLAPKSMPEPRNPCQEPQKRCSRPEITRTKRESESSAETAHSLVRSVRSREIARASFQRAGGGLSCEVARTGRGVGLEREELWTVEAVRT